jgi:hypothetical protein
VTPLPPDVQAGKVELNRHLRGLVDKSLLDAITGEPGVARSTDMRAQRNNGISEINRLVESREDIDSFAARL